MYDAAMACGKPSLVETELSRLPASNPLEPWRARAGESQHSGSAGNFVDLPARVNDAAAPGIVGGSP